MTDSWYFKSERRSTVRIVLGPDAPSVCPNDGAADTQAHSHAGAFRREKWLPDIIQLCRIDAWAEVPHRYLNTVIVCLSS